MRNLATSLLTVISFLLFLGSAFSQDLFAPKVDYGAGSGPAGVTSADFDGDGKMDLAVANAFSDNISILLNDGFGTFQPAVNYDAGNGLVVGNSPG